MLATANTGKKIGRGLEKNAGEWTGRVEISKEKIPGIKRKMYDYILTNSRLLLMSRDETSFFVWREVLDARTPSRQEVYCYHLMMNHDFFSFLFFVHSPRNGVLRAKTEN